VTLVLVDFGNTLAEETFMRCDSEAFPHWTSVWMDVMTEARVDWDTGRMSAGELAARLASEFGCTSEAVRAYMSELCRQLVFYPAINVAVRSRRARGGRQVLVTVNPDLFDEVVAHYSLAQHFDAVVTSAASGTDDKVELCHEALRRMGVENPADTVLIDNMPFNVEGWAAAGGMGYPFTSDDAFARDVRSGRVPGFHPSDLAVF
jgi:FMN phosphatase YigB (HAD superfamily)